MKTLGNLIWLIFGGLVTSIEYLVSSMLLMVTIVGIPFGVQSIKMAALCLWPFGATIKKKETPLASGCLNTIMNIIWILFGGIWIFLTHVLFGVLLTITLIGIPFGKQHFKLAGMAFTPFGREIVR